MEELLELTFTPPQRIFEQLKTSRHSAAVRFFAFMITDLQDLAALGIDLSGTLRDDVLTDPEFAKWRRVSDRVRKQIATLLQDASVEGDLLIAPDLAAVIHESLVKELIRVMGQGRLGGQWPEQTAGVLMRGMVSDGRRANTIRREAIALANTLRD